VGCHLNLTYDLFKKKIGKGQKFAGFRAFAGLSLQGVRGNFLINYGPSLSIYTKSIGANLNPLVGDIQIDLTNSFSVGGSWGSDLDYLKFFRTIHTGDYYNVVTQKRNCALLTANFILNNHRRNQVVGAINGSFGNFTLNYYNDGAVPFTFLPVADNFDRFWTGGGALFLHSKKGYNYAELSFDQFTGYTPLLYELSNVLGINIPLYDEPGKDSSRRKIPNTYNTSQYQLKIGLDKNFSIDAGILGNLVDGNGRHYGIQDLIHMGLKLPLHPNNDPNRLFIGASYNLKYNVPL
jgi:hypothetical protein